MAALPFTWRTGIVDKSAVNVGVFSQSGAAVTVVLAGQSKAITMVARGTDADGVNDSGHSEAMFSGVVQFTGLATGQHSFTVTQGSITRNGTTYTDLGDVDSCIVALSCDKNDATGTGGYPAIRAKAEDASKPPLFAMLFVDDHGYVADWILDDSLNSGKWIDAKAPDVGNEFAYYLCYAGFFGLIKSQTQYHQQEDRIWCFENLPCMSANGDWEITNNPEESTSVTAGLITVATNAYKNTVGLTDTPINSANGMAWVKRLGSMEVISVDRIQNLAPLTQLYDPATEANQVSNNTWLGSNQISDILGALTESPFKMLLSGIGNKHITTAQFRLDDATSGFKSQHYGAQEPLHDYTGDVSNLTSADGENARCTTSEYYELLASKANKGLFGWGVPVISCHGDVHYPKDMHFHTSETSNYYSTDLRAFNTGAINQNFSHVLSPKVGVGTGIDGGNFVYLPDWVKRTPQSDGGNGIPFYSCLFIEMEAGGDIEVNIIDARTSSYSTMHSDTIKRGSANSAPGYLQVGHL